MTTFTPFVTVYITTRNRAHLLERAVDSVLRQGRDDIEILVVDDASDDDTPSLLHRLGSTGSIRSIRNESRRGACASRNRALREAHGRYVAGLDDDDEMLPDRIEILLAALRPEDAFVCASDFLEVGGKRHHLRICPPRIDLSAILTRNIVGNQVLVERDKLLACNGFDESLPAAQDYDLWIRMIDRHGPARGVRRPLQIIHAHAEAPRISSSPARRRGYWSVFLKHRSKMTRVVRAVHLYNLHKAAGKRIGNAHARAFFVPGNRLRVLARILSERAPILSNYIRRISEAYVDVIVR